MYRSPPVPGLRAPRNRISTTSGGPRPVGLFRHAVFLLSFRWLPPFFLFLRLERASEGGAGARAGNVPAVYRGVFFYAQEAFLRPRATFCRVTGFAAFVTQRRPVLLLAASSLVTEPEAPEAPGDHPPSSHSTVRHADLEAG